MPVEKRKTTSILLFVFRCIPRTVRKGFFLLLFALFYHLVPKNRLIALHNLRCSFPEKEMDELIRITKGVYRNFAIVAAEFFDLPYINKQNIDKWVEVEGLENYRKANARGATKNIRDAQRTKRPVRSGLAIRRETSERS